MEKNVTNIFVNADDFGRSETINMAITEAFSKGYINRTTIMVNMPYYEQAVMLAKEHGFFDKVGLHLNFTLGEPLTKLKCGSTKFVDHNGCFNSNLIDNTINRFCLPSLEINFLKEECVGQMKKYIDCGFSLMHVDSHHHIHTNFSLFFFISNIARKKGFKSMRICRNLTSNNEGRFKYLYKSFINYIIRKRFVTTDWMGSYYDIQYYKGKGNVEVMVHPDMINGELLDVIDRGNNLYQVLSDISLINNQAVYERFSDRQAYGILGRHLSGKQREYGKNKVKEQSTGTNR